MKTEAILNGQQKITQMKTKNSVSINNNLTFDGKSTKNDLFLVIKLNEKIIHYFRHSPLLIIQFVN